MPKALDITNQKFGNLTAIKKVASKNGKTYWLCKCDCGNEKEIQTSHLVNGSIKSCGCGKFQSIKKQCEICGTEFETKVNGASRKYCYECSPSYPKGGSRAETIKSLRKAMKREAVKRLGGECCKCGYNKYIGALQFHHLNPAPEFHHCRIIHKTRAGLLTRNFHSPFTKTKDYLSSIFFIPISMYMPL